MNILLNIMDLLSAPGGDHGGKCGYRLFASIFGAFAPGAYLCCNEPHLQPYASLSHRCGEADPSRKRRLNFYPGKTKNAA